MLPWARSDAVSRSIVITSCFPFHRCRHLIIFISFSPSSLSANSAFLRYAAVITVLAYLVVNRLGPLAAKQMHEFKVKAVVKAEQKQEEAKAWIQDDGQTEKQENGPPQVRRGRSSFLGKRQEKQDTEEVMKREKKKVEEKTDQGVLAELWRFHKLPAETQKLVEGGLRERIQGLLHSAKTGAMPKIGKPPSKFVSMTLKASTHDRESDLSFSRVQRNIVPVKSESGATDKKASSEPQREETDDNNEEEKAPTSTQLIAKKGLEYLDSITWYVVYRP